MAAAPAVLPARRQARRKFLRALAAAASAPALLPVASGFAAANEGANPPLASAAPASAPAAALPRHHLPSGGFRNNHIAAINKPFADLLRWRREAPSRPLLSFATAQNNPAALAANRATPGITWVGHATLLLQQGGLNLLTDPHFSERASPLSFVGPKRGTPPGLALDDLPPIDAVLISHNHYDHLDSASIRALAAAHPRARFFAPLRLGAALQKMAGNNAQVEELDWGQSARVGGLQIAAEPCQHWSRRFYGDTNSTLWASWAVAGGGLKFLFIGDTGYSPDFAALGQKYGGFDAAAIPIGAYEPRWFMKQAHINPQEAAQIFIDLRARFAVATHWGTFKLTDEAMDEPPQKLREALAAAGVDEARFAVFAHGETRDLSFLSQA